MKKKIVILASGKGSNAGKIIDQFYESDTVEVCAVITNRKAAGVLDVAERNGVHSLYISNSEVKDGMLLKALQRLAADLIVLAGYLMMIPQNVTNVFGNKMINIHPSLLPKFGGKGMYGSHVMKAVLEAGETESGITIHYVNEAYDKGEVIAQYRCDVLPNDTVDRLSRRVQSLEHKYLPLVIKNLLT